MGNKYVIGVDYGSDSCRALLVDARSGAVISSAVSVYKRWAEGLYCDPQQNRYRQHPQDYIDSLEEVLGLLLRDVTDEVRACVVGMAFDTTGSTPALTDAAGTPLALLPEFAENPDAMFVLWKDHTAICEADEINALARRSPVDFTAYSGGIYSSEWVWAKMLHVLRVDASLREKAYSWVEHCDWITGLITGNTRPETVFRGRCAAGHKAMWNERWGGLPSQEFLSQLDPLFDGIRERLFTQTYTGDQCAGRLAPDWAARFGLPTSVKVAVGLLDAHMGAVGAGALSNVLVRILGTSTCDIIAVEPEVLNDKLIPGICGQVDGSVLPGCIGLEAGQSAFGDVYAWFRRILMWPVEHLSPELRVGLEEQLIPALSRVAMEMEPTESGLLALDWLNGRRTPDADYSVRGAITGLTLGTTAPMLFRALVEATAFGSRAIVERLRESGIQIDGVIAVGGIANKSPFVMQLLADVLDVPIEVSASEQSCALGASMYAAVVGGVYASLPEAQQVFRPGVAARYDPSERVAIYNRLYAEYQALGSSSLRVIP